jgi:hypothetical protein
LASSVEAPIANLLYDATIYRYKNDRIIQPGETRYNEQQYTDAGRKKGIKYTLSATPIDRMHKDARYTM